MRIGAPDATVTGLAGLVAIDELTAWLGLVVELDRGIGPFKARDRDRAGPAARGRGRSGVRTGRT